MPFPTTLRVSLLFGVAALSCHTFPAAFGQSSRPVRGPSHLPIPEGPPATGERDFVDPRPYFLIDGLLVLYYVAVYKWLNRNQTSGSIAVQYAAPAHLSPAQARYLLTEDSDRKTVAATILHLAARGLVTIRCLDNFYLIAKRSDRLPPDLAPEEAAAFAVMFNLAPSSELPAPDPFVSRALPKGSFLLHPIQGNNFTGVLKAIHKTLRAGFEHRFFTNHMAFSIPAAIASMVWLLATDMLLPYAIMHAVLILSGIFVINFTPWTRDVLRGRMGPPQNVRYAIGLILYMTYVAVVAGSAHRFTNTFEFALVFAVLMNILFPLKFWTPTAEGRRLLVQLDGYRVFLNTAEIDRLHRILGDSWIPGQNTVNLAYAIAFDLRDAWEDYLAQADFHSVYLQPSPNKPALPGAPALVSTTSGPGPYLWRVFFSWQVILAALIVFLANAFTDSQAGFLKPLFVVALLARVAYVYVAHKK